MEKTTSSTTVAPPRLVTTIKDKDSYSRSLKNGHLKKTIAGSYNVFKSIINPYVKWITVSVGKGPIYSSVGVSGDFGISLVVWIPTVGFYIHDLEADVIDDTKVFTTQKNYFINEEHVESLTREVYSIINKETIRESLVEHFTGAFENVVFNNVMKYCQPEIYKQATDINEYLEEEVGDNNPHFCYFCGEQLIVRSLSGTIYGRCDCKESYSYNEMCSIVLMYYAVCPDKFTKSIYTKVNRDNKSVEKERYEYKLGTHTFILRVTYNSIKVDGISFGCWTRGQYYSLKETREKCQP